MENSINTISTINPAIMENMAWSLMCALDIDLKVIVLLGYAVSLSFISSLFKHIGSISNK